MQKLISEIVTLSLLTGMVVSQAKPAPKVPATSAPASQTVQKSTMPAKPAPAKPAPMSAAKPAPMSAAKPKPAPKKTVAPATTASAKKPAPPARAKRDPFVSPVRMQGGPGMGAPACTTGPRCLVIAQVVLKGVVKTQNGMIAMVENSAKKQYNLREKDTVQSGFVLKITNDSIVFRETVTDMLGNSNSREVVKRVTVPAV